MFRLLCAVNKREIKVHTNCQNVRASDRVHLILVNVKRYDKMTEALSGLHIGVNFCGYSFDTLFVSLRDI